MNQYAIYSVWCLHSVHHLEIGLSPSSWTLSQTSHSQISYLTILSRSQENGGHDLRNLLTSCTQTDPRCPCDNFPSPVGCPQLPNHSNCSPPSLNAVSKVPLAQHGPYEPGPRILRCYPVAPVTPHSPDFFFHLWLLLDPCRSFSFSVSLKCISQGPTLALFLLPQSVPGNLLCYCGLRDHP